MSLSKNLQMLLTERKMSLSQLSRSSGVAKSTLSGISAGTRKIDLITLQRIARSLQVSVHQLAYGEPDPFEAPAGELLTEIFRGDVRVILQRIERKDKAK